MYYLEYYPKIRRLILMKIVKSTTYVMPLK